MPSIKCNACAKFLSPTEGAKCNKCNAWYHRSCVAFPLRGPIPSAWMCVTCNSKCGRSSIHDDESSSEEFADPQPLDVTPVATRNNFCTEFQKLAQELRDEFRAMREEIRSDVSQMRDVVKALTLRMDSLETRIDAIESTLSSGKALVTEEVIQELKRELNDREQELLANDVEIANLPEVAGENTVHTVQLIAAKLNMQLEERDIVSAERVGGRHIIATSPAGGVEARARRVVVRLARRDVRDALLKAARVRRGATSADLGLAGPPRRFYVNERLTKHNRQLFRLARDAAQELGWQFVWTKKGKILARRKHGEPASQIRNEGDIRAIFGREVEKQARI